MFVNVHGVTLQTASGISAHFLSLKSLCGEIKGYWEILKVPRGAIVT